MAEKLLIRTPPDHAGVRVTFAVTIPEGMSADDVYMMIVSEMDPYGPLPEMLSPSESLS